MKLIAQIFVCIFLLYGYLSVLKDMIEGAPAKPAKEPQGMSGLIVTTIVVAMITSIYYFAGTFSEITALITD